MASPKVITSRAPVIKSFLVTAHAQKKSPNSVRMLRAQDLSQEISGRFMLGVAEKLLRRRLLDDPAVGHEYYPVCHTAGKAHFMRHAQPGHALLGQADHG